MASETLMFLLEAQVEDEIIVGALEELAASQWVWADVGGMDLFVSNFDGVIPLLPQLLSHPSSLVAARSSQLLTNTFLIAEAATGDNSALLHRAVSTVAACVTTLLARLEAVEVDDPYSCEVAEMTIKLLERVRNADGVLVGSGGGGVPVPGGGEAGGGGNAFIQLEPIEALRAVHAVVSFVENHGDLFQTDVKLSALSILPMICALSQFDEDEVVEEEEGSSSSSSGAAAAIDEDEKLARSLFAAEKKSSSSSSNQISQMASALSPLCRWLKKSTSSASLRPDDPVNLRILETLDSFIDSCCKQVLVSSAAASQDLDEHIQPLLQEGLVESLIYLIEHGTGETLGRSCRLLSVLCIKSRNTVLNSHLLNPDSETSTLFFKMLTRVLKKVGGGGASGSGAGASPATRSGSGGQQQQQQQNSSGPAATSSSSSSSSAAAASPADTVRALRALQLADLLRILTFNGKLDAKKLFLLYNSRRKVFLEGGIGGAFGGLPVDALRKLFLPQEEKEGGNQSLSKAELDESIILLLAGEDPSLGCFSAANPSPAANAAAGGNLFGGGGMVPGGGGGLPASSSIAAAVAAAAAAFSNLSNSSNNEDDGAPAAAAPTRPVLPTISLSAMRGIVRSGDLNAVRRAIAMGAPIDSSTNEISPLIEAAARSSPEMISLLVTMKADINACSGPATALHFAIVRGKVANVRTLLSLGADPSKTDQSGKTPKDIAQSHAFPGKDSVIKMLSAPPPPRVVLVEEQLEETEKDREEDKSSSSSLRLGQARFFNQILPAIFSFYSSTESDQERIRIQILALVLKLVRSCTADFLLKQVDVEVHDELANFASSGMNKWEESPLSAIFAGLCVRELLKKAQDPFAQLFIRHGGVVEMERAAEEVQQDDDSDDVDDEEGDDGQAKLSSSLSPLAFFSASDLEKRKKIAVRFFASMARQILETHFQSSERGVPSQIQLELQNAAKEIIDILNNDGEEKKTEAELVKLLENALQRIKVAVCGGGAAAIDSSSSSSSSSRSSVATTREFIDSRVCDALEMLLLPTTTENSETSVPLSLRKQAFLSAFSRTEDLSRLIQQLHAAVDSKERLPLMLLSRGLGGPGGAGLEVLSKQLRLKFVVSSRSVEPTKLMKDLQRDVDGLEANVEILASVDQLKEFILSNMLKPADPKPAAGAQYYYGSASPGQTLSTGNANEISSSDVHLAVISDVDLRILLKKIQEPSTAQLPPLFVIPSNEMVSVVAPGKSIGDDAAQFLSSLMFRLVTLFVNHPAPISIPNVVDRVAVLTSGPISEDIIELISTSELDVKPDETVEGKAIPVQGQFPALFRQLRSTLCSVYPEAIGANPPSHVVAIYLAIEHLCLRILRLAVEICSRRQSSAIPGPFSASFWKPLMQEPQQQQHEDEEEEQEEDQESQVELWNRSVGPCFALKRPIGHRLFSSESFYAADVEKINDNGSAVVAYRDGDRDESLPASLIRNFPSPEQLDRLIALKNAIGDAGGGGGWEDEEEEPEVHVEVDGGEEEEEDGEERVRRSHRFGVGGLGGGYGGGDVFGQGELVYNPPSEPVSKFSFGEVGGAAAVEGVSSPGGLASFSFGQYIQQQQQQQQQATTPSEGADSVATATTTTTTTASPAAPPTFSFSTPAPPTHQTPQPPHSDSAYKAFHALYSNWGGGGGGGGAAAEEGGRGAGYHLSPSPFGARPNGQHNNNNNNNNGSNVTREYSGFEQEQMWSAGRRGLGGDGLAIQTPPRQLLISLDDSSVLEGGGPNLEVANEEGEGAATAADFAKILKRLRLKVVDIGKRAGVPPHHHRSVAAAAAVKSPSSSTELKSNLEMNNDSECVYAAIARVLMENNIETNLLWHSVVSIEYELIDEEEEEKSLEKEKIDDSSSKKPIIDHRNLGVLLSVLNQIASISPSASISKLCVNDKISRKLLQQLGDPLAAVCRITPPWCSHLIRSLPLLFSFSTRLQFFRIFALGVSRAVDAIQRQMAANRSRAVRIPALVSEVVRVDRDRLLEWGEAVLQAHAAKKTNLLFQFRSGGRDENGIGTGATREFYSSFAAELCSSATNSILPVWRVGANESQGVGVFPAPLPSNPEVASRILKRCRTVGRFIGKSLQQQQTPGLDLSLPLWRLILLQPLTFEDVIQIEPSIASSIKMLDDILAEYRVQKAGGSDLSSLSQTISSLSLSFCSPNGDGTAPLCASFAADTEVTLENLSDFLFFLKKFYVSMEFGELVTAQVKEMREGMGEVVEIEQVSVFLPQEMRNLLWTPCDWTREDLEKYVIADAGYTSTSQILVWLRDVLTSLDGNGRRRFLQFATGSPCLPLAGLAGLVARDGKVGLRVSQRTTSGDKELVTCNTCLHKVKLPSYSSKEVLLERLEFSIANSVGLMDFD